jgi:hypothetical protein
MSELPARDGVWGTLCVRWSWFARWICGGLAAAFALLWVFTLFVCVMHVLPGKSLTVISGGGITWTTDSPVDNVPGKPLASAFFHYPEGWSIRASGTLSSWRSVQFLCWTYVNYGSLVKTPLWMPPLVFACPSAIMWERRLRRKRQGACVNCGYDLAGLPPSAVCPECGATR